MSARPPLSACIIAMDEEDRLGACLASLAFCDEIVVVDSHSSDGTRELAAARGARVIERDWPGHVAQGRDLARELGREPLVGVHAQHPVVARRADRELLLRDAGFPGQAGWRFPRLSRYLGVWVRRGTWYPDHQLRLFDRRRGRWGGHNPHDRVELDGSVGTLAGDLLHEPYRDLAEHLETIDRYTTIMAQGLRDRGRRASLLDLVLRPPVRFLRFYVLRGGFLLGWRGLVLAYLAAHYVRLKYVKLLVLQRAPAAE